MTRIWTRETVLSVLQEAGAEHGYWTVTKWTQTKRQPTADTVKCLFGGWTVAWEAAGYPGPHPGQHWTQQTAREALARIGEERSQWLTIQEWEQAGYLPSIPTVFRLFGSWRAAWNAAGFTLPSRWQHHHHESQGTWTRDTVLTALRRHTRSDGTIMNSNDWNRNKLHPTVSTIIKICGSYPAAVHALGVSIVSDAQRRNRLAQADYQRAFQRLTEHLGHHPSRQEWDAWSEKPTNIPGISLSILPFRKTRGALYDALQSTNLDGISGTREHAWALRYRSGETLEALAQDAGLSRERVRQRLQHALHLAQRRQRDAIRANLQHRAASAAAALLSNGVSDPWVQTILEMVVHRRSFATIARATHWPIGTVPAFFQALADRPSEVPQRVTVVRGSMGSAHLLSLWPDPSSSLDVLALQRSASVEPSMASQAIDSLPLLPLQIIHRLRRGRITTVKTLMEMSITELTRLPGITLADLSIIERQRTAIRRGNLADPVLFLGDTTSVFCLEGLSTRTLRCLHRASIATLGDLKSWTDDDLLRVPNFGLGCLREVRQLLSQLEASCD